MSLLLSIGITTVSSWGQLLYSNNFDYAEEARVYTEEDLAIDWANPTWNNGVPEGRVSLVTGDEAFGDDGASLAVFFPANETVSESGAQWKLDLLAPYKQVRLRYRVKFSANFNFASSGKLPGLAGGVAPTGSVFNDNNVIADGENGWTARLMWIDYQSSVPFGGLRVESGRLVQSFRTYASPFVRFDGSPISNGGIDFWVGVDDDQGTPVQLLPETWFTVTQLVKMNSVGRSNGLIKVWVNGKLGLSQRDMAVSDHERSGDRCALFQHLPRLPKRWR